MREEFRLINVDCQFCWYKFIAVMEPDVVMVACPECDSFCILGSPDENDYDDYLWPDDEYH